MSKSITEHLDELPALVWSLCDLLFGQLRADFHAPAAQYLELSKTRIRALLGHDTARLLPRDEAAQTSAENSICRIRELLKTTGIDLTVAHLRSRRVPEQSHAGWLRVAAGPLYDEHPRVIDGTFNRWRLLQSAFEKAKQPRGMIVQFMNDETARSAPADRELFLHRSDWEPIVDAFRLLDAHDPSRHQFDATDVIQRMPPMAVDRISHRVGRFWSKHLDSRLEEDANVAALIESTVVTLNLLASGNVSAPRAVLLIPVFVGHERVGGFSFFSRSAVSLDANASRLEVFARVLALYFATREAQELEVQSRLLEQLTPVTHLFIHTFNKAFTTPVLNLADDVAAIATRVADGETDAASDGDRLEAISIFLKAFARRWAGTFPALQFMSAGELDGHITGRRFLNAPLSVIDTDDLAEHTRAVFALYLSSDITDDSAFSTYADSLTRMDALDLLVDLRLDLSEPVPGYADIWLLHLLNLAQNAIEALPLRQVLEKYRDHPALMTPEYFLRMTTERYEDEAGHAWLRLEVANNGTPFSAEIRRALNDLLARFNAGPAPPTLWEVQMANRANPQRYSTKSGESYGSGLTMFADYLSRICRVRVRHEPDVPAEDALQAGEIVSRGSLQIVDGGTETRIEVNVPTGRTVGADSDTVTCLERR